MISSKAAVTAGIAAGLQLVSAVDLNVNDTTSILGAARTFAYGVQSYYTANATGASATAVGTFPPPSYWWEGGAIWGGMVDYWAYTNDTSYNEVITQALLAQIGPDSNYMPPAYYSSLGNDDQAFWAVAALSAMEYGFPVPEGQKDTLWLDLASAVWNTQAPRWDNATCGGGLRWQIFESNAGYTYKNSISNGGFFQISARLARYTGNQTYVEWANKSWNWMTAVGLVSSGYQVFDGSDSTKNCTELDHTQWSYAPAMLIYGTAIMANHTNQKVWRDRTEGLLTTIENTFFSPYSNASDIMFEPACEPVGTCNYDQLSFKAYLARWMAKAAAVHPPIADNVSKYLKASALAASKACTGGTDGQTCGQKWYTGGYDGAYGVGQELSAMETVQGLLLLDGDAAHLVPKHQPNVTVQVNPETSTFPLTAPTSPAIPQSSSGSSSGRDSTSSASDTNSGHSLSVMMMTPVLAAAVTIVTAWGLGGACLGLRR